MAVDYKPNQNDYKDLTPFKSWLLLQINTWGQNNFPFVESDFDELTNYGMMQKLMQAVNDVISNSNLVEEDMTNLFNAYTELQNYVNNYFDNLDVQDEINNKLDEMAEDGSLTELIERFLTPYINDMNDDIEHIRKMVQASNNGSPLVASSTSGMSDTTKTYVNTTDGYWYYYNGSAWVRGGIYQETTISNGSITPQKTNFIETIINEENLIDSENLIYGYWIGGTNQTPVANENFAYIKCDDFIPGQTYTWGGWGTGIVSCFNDTQNVLLNDRNQNATFTIPDDAINCYISLGRGSIPHEWITKGTTASANYSPYSKINLIDEYIIDMNAYNPNNLNDGVVTPEKTSFLIEQLNENNLLDTSNLIEGYYIGGSIVPAVNENYGYYQSYDLKPGETYTLNGGGVMIVSCFNSSNVNLLVNDSSQNRTFTIPENTTQVFISCSLASANNQWINKGDTPYPTKTDYYKKYVFDDDIDTTNSQMNIVIVDKNGNGNYTSLQSAVANSPDNSIILVYPGIYENEVVEGFGKTLYIIGIDKQNCIIKNNNCDYNTPPFEFGSGLLRNLTIISEYNESNYNNVSGWKSYAVHIEDDNLYNKKLSIENCHIESQVNYAIGMGTRGGCDVIIENCELVGSTTRSEDGAGGLYFHDAANSLYSGTQNIHILNNRILSLSPNNSTELRVESQNTLGSEINVEFVDNVVVNNVNGNTTIRFVDHADEQWKTHLDDLTNFHLTYSSFGNNSNRLNK